MIYMKTIALMLLLTFSLAPSAKGQGSKEKLYVWDFAADKSEQHDLAAKFTSEFQVALVQSQCFQVLERRSLDQLLRQIKNENAVLGIESLNQDSRKLLKDITKAEVVVFGKVTYDIDDGKIEISVSFQRFDATIINERNTRIQYGLRFDSETRKKAMKEMVEGICSPRISSSQNTDSDIIPVNLSKDELTLLKYHFTFTRNNITYDGYFERKAGRADWTEHTTDTEHTPIYYYQEVKGEPGWITLYDSGRNALVRIRIEGGQVQYKPRLSGTWGVIWVTQKV